MIFNFIIFINNFEEKFYNSLYIYKMLYGYLLNIIISSENGGNLFYLYIANQPFCCCSCFVIIFVVVYFVVVVIRTILYLSVSNSTVTVISHSIIQLRNEFHFSEVYQSVNYIGWRWLLQSK